MYSGSWRLRAFWCVLGAILVLWCVALVARVAFAQGGALRCPDGSSVGEGTPFPPDVSHLDLGYLRRCSDCFIADTATPGPYSIGVTPIATMAWGTPAPLSLGLSEEVLGGLSPQAGSIVDGGEWFLPAYVTDSPPVHQFVIGAGEGFGQAITVGPFPGAVHGVVFDVEFASGNDTVVGGWGLDVNVASAWRQVAGTFFPNDTPDFYRGGIMPLVNTGLFPEPPGALRVCVGYADACGVASGVGISDILEQTISGEFTFGLYVQNEGVTITGLWFIGEWQSEPQPTMTPTVALPSPTATLSPWLGYHGASSVSCYATGASVSDPNNTLIGGDGSYASYSITSAVGSYFSCTWVFDPPVKVEDGGGEGTWRFWHTYTRNEWEGIKFKDVDGNECYNCVGNYCADGTPTKGGAGICPGKYVNYAYFDTGGGNNNVWTGTFDGPVLYGYRGSPNYPVTPTPTPTVVATLTPPVATPLPGSLDCRVLEWRESTDALVDFGFDGEWLREGDCYDLVSEFSLSIPSIGLIGFDGHTLEWDGLQLCVDWVQFPALKILGVQFSISLVLIVVLAYVMYQLLRW